MRWCTPAYFGRASVKFAAISTSAAPNAPDHADDEPPPGAGCWAATASRRSLRDWSANGCKRNHLGSEEPDGPPVGVDVDVQGRGRAPQAGHLRDVTAQRHEPPRAGVGADVAHRQ